MSTALPTRKTYQEYLDGTTQVLEQSQVETKIYEVEILGHKFVLHPNVFSPKYFFDTEFFAKELPVVAGEEFLEIGPGSGVTVVFAALRGAKHVTAIDINPDAVAITKENALINNVADKVTVKQGDMYDVLDKGEKFDTIYWNTPFGYVNETEDLTLLEKSVFDPGYKSTNKFISQAKKHLKHDGRLLIGFSTTLGKFDILQDLLTKAGFKVNLLVKTESVETYPVLFEIFEAKF